MGIGEFLVENSAQGIAIFSQWSLTFCNDAFAEIFGFAPEELVAMDHVKCLFYPEDIEQLEAYNKARNKGLNPPVNYECKGIKKDGSIIWLNCTVTKSDLDGISYSMHVADVTTSKKKQQELELTLLQKTLELKAEKESLKRISNSIQVGIWHLDDDGELIFANNAYLTIFGRRWNDIKGKQYANFFHPDDAALRIGAESSDGEVEIRIVRPSGEIRYVKIQYTHMEGEDALVGTMIDITRKRTLLPELQELKASLVSERSW